MAAAGLGEVDTLRTGLASSVNIEEGSRAEKMEGEQQYGESACMCGKVRFVRM